MGQGTAGAGGTQSLGAPGGTPRLHRALLVFRDSPLSPPREHRGIPHFGEKPFRGPSLRPPPWQWGLLVPPSLKAPEAERGFARGGGILSALSEHRQRGCKLGGGSAFLYGSFSTCQRPRVLKARGRRGILCRCVRGVPRSPRGEQGPAAPEFTQSSARVRGTFNWIGEGGGHLNSALPEW